MYAQPAVPCVTAAEVTAEHHLIDVREADEWAAGHAPQAHHVPMMQVPGRVGELPSDREVVVVCRVGNRSANVVAYLRSHGFGRVHNLDGGMAAWQAAGLPMVSDDGYPARVL